LDEINIKLLRGTYDEAVQYAMSSNFKNGVRPSKADAARCIPMLLKTAPDFGCSSKLVVPWLRSFGIPRTTAQDHTKAIRELMDEERDSTILRLLEQGDTQSAIAESLGVSESLIKRVKAASRSDSRVGELTPTKDLLEPSRHDASVSELEDGSAFFDEDECDTSPAINPADAFNKALEEHEAERKDKPKTEKEISPVDSIKAILRRSGIYEKLSRAEVNQALAVIIKAS